jgi:7tm Odorant receptor
MKNYFTFNQKALQLLGINFECAERKFDKPLRIFSLIAVLLTTFQSVLFVMFATQFDLKLSSALTISFYGIQGCFKFVAVLCNIEKLKKLKESLNELMKSLEADQDEENAKDLNKFRKITKITLMTNVACFWMFLFEPLIGLIYFYFSKGIIVKKLPFAFYYPFETLKAMWCFCAIHIYEVFFGQFLVVVAQSMDNLIILILGQLVALLKSLGDEFAKIISEFEASKRQVTVKKLKRTIDLQNKIFDLCDEFFDIFEIALLTNVILQTGTICFIAFMVSVR